MDISSGQQNPVLEITECKDATIAHVHNLLDDALPLDGNELLDDGLLRHLHNPHSQGLMMAPSLSAKKKKILEIREQNYLSAI